jgi:hypothetical protein
LHVSPSGLSALGTARPVKLRRKRSKSASKEGRPRQVARGGCAPHHRLPPAADPRRRSLVARGPPARGRPRKPPESAPHPRVRPGPGGRASRDPGTQHGSPPRSRCVVLRARRSDREPPWDPSLCRLLEVPRQRHGARIPDGPASRLR